MQNFSFATCPIQGLYHIQAFNAADERGNFTKYYEKDVFLKAGINTSLNECFESHSKKGVVRGLHFQTQCPQSKLIYVNYGKIFDVAVDLRQSSPSFGKWHGVLLDAEKHNAFYIPQGFAHGFMALAQHNIVSYCCSGPYNAKADTGIVWSDETIAINWPTPKDCKPIVSLKDQALCSFKSFANSFGGL